MPGSTVTDGSLSPPQGEFTFDFPQGIVTDEEEATEPLDYSKLTPDFSDDDGDGEIDRQKAAAEAGKPRRKSKKSPRRAVESDDDTEPEPMSKRARKTMFGGDSTPSEPEDDIRVRLDSINLDGEDVAAQHAQVHDFGCQPLGPSPPDSRASPTPSEDSEDIDIPEDTTPVYNFRAHRPKFGTTYLDTDKSGNFDPALEAEQKILRLQRAKAQKAARRTRKGKKRKNTTKGPCTCGDGKFLLRLVIENWSQLRINTDDSDSCPARYKPPCEECEDVQNTYRKNRVTLPRFYQIPIEDPAREFDDLTGHPEARGCRLCRYDGTLEGSPCDLIHGGEYPCVNCQNKGEPCELIVPANANGRCKQCTDGEKDDCSFETDPGQAICDNCYDDEAECEPLPPHGYKAPRISMDEILYGPDRPMIKCARCFVENRQCNLEGKDGKPPCKACTKTNTACFFRDEKILKPLQKQRATNKSAPIFTNGQSFVPEVSIPSADLFTAEELADFEESSDDEDFSREPSPEMEMEDFDGNKGWTTKIKTSFAHPIRFSSLFDAATSDMCSFCEIPFFSLVGHCEREVHVIRWNTGLGYSEIGGGHCEHQGSTMMCHGCVVERAQILNCEDHKISALSVPEAIPTFDDLSARLCELGGDREAFRTEMSKWCSFCLMPAEYACSRLQPALLSRGGEGDEEERGCGLRLCKSCESDLGGTYGGNVSDMAGELDNIDKAVEGEEALAAKVRADVGLLSEEGLLMKNLDQEIDG